MAKKIKSFECKGKIPRLESKIKKKKHVKWHTSCEDKWNNKDKEHAERLQNVEADNVKKTQERLKQQQLAKKVKERKNISCIIS